MTELSFPAYFSESFMQLIPKQRQMIVELLNKGTLASFSLSNDRKKAWMVVKAKNEDRVHELLERFPMYDYFDYSVSELALHDIQFLGMPQLILN